MWYQEDAIVKESIVEDVGLAGQADCVSGRWPVFAPPLRGLPVGIRDLICGLTHSILSVFAAVCPRCSLTGLG